MPGRFATWWSLRRQRLHALRMARAPGRVPVIVRLIATGKLLKACGFIILGLTIGRMIHAPDVAAWAAALMEHVHIDPDGRHAQQALSWLSSVPHHRLTEIGAGAFAYAVIYVVEGLGLWFDRRWAEWLTVIGTVAFIPFEVVHFAHKPSFGITLVILINVAVAAYLARRLWLRRAQPEAPRVADGGVVDERGDRRDDVR
jgi:uncharacterized membrane protein (DUF2068 family)